MRDDDGYTEEGDNDDDWGQVEVRIAFADPLPIRQNSFHQSVMKHGMQHFVRCTSKFCPHPTDTD